MRVCAFFSFFRNQVLQDLLTKSNSETTMENGFIEFGG